MITHKIKELVMSNQEKQLLINKIVALWDKYYSCAHNTISIDITMIRYRTLDAAGEKLGRGIIFGKRSFKSTAVNEFTAHIATMTTNIVPELQKLLNHMRRIILLIHRAINEYLIETIGGNCPHHCGDLSCMAYGSNGTTTECERRFEWQVDDDELIDSFSVTNTVPIGEVVRITH